LGEVSLEQTNPFTLDDTALATFRNRKIGFVFQDHHLLPQCTVLENVLIPTLVNREAGSEVATYAKSLLERVGLGERLNHRPAELSGGERQRVAVARSLIQKPLLLLADEPTGNLDRKTAQQVGELLLKLHEEEKTILVVVTHSAELAKRFPRRMEMIDGNLEKTEN
jgi:lipoprotein-releasing system ATP-binding protein